MTAQSKLPIKTRPLWMEAISFDDKLGEDVLPQKTDVVVVGSGYTGLHAALYLIKKGLSVTILEREHIGWGASSRTAGKMVIGLKPSAVTLLKRYGPKLGRELWNTAIESVDLVESVVRMEGIECSFARNGSLVTACKPSHFSRMRKNVKWMKQNLNYDLELVEKKDLLNEVGTDFYHGGVLDPRSAALQPAEYTVGLARAIKRRGGVLSHYNPLISYEKTKNEYLITSQKGSFKAKHVVLATNGYLSSASKAIRPYMIPIGSYIIATEPLSAALQKKISPNYRSFYDSKWFLHYFRITPDGRLLFGGRSSLSTDLDLHKSAELLRVEMTKVFPYLKNSTITHSWGGNLSLTLPMMPKLYRKDNVVGAFGYSGHGVSLGSYLGKVLGKWVLNKDLENPYRRVKVPKVFFYRNRPWMTPFINVSLRFLDFVS